MMTFHCQKVSKIATLKFSLNHPFYLWLATVTKMIQEMLPHDVVCTKETRDLLIDCCVGKHLLFSVKFMILPSIFVFISIFLIEFIHLISSEANDTCEKDNRKTISPEHVLTALQVDCSMNHFFPIFILYVAIGIWSVY